MLVVIPVSSSDSELVEPFSKAVRHFGANSNHTALIVARPADQAHANKLLASLDGMFESISIHLFDQDGPEGWPLGPNFYWASTFHYLMNTQNPQPWLWMELDTTPLKEGWADALATEYNLTQSKFMGNIVKTHATDADGKEVSAGNHLVGVAIYPPDVSQYSLLRPYVAQMPTPFDVVCQWEFVPHSRETPLMQHGFRTQNYKRSEDGEIKGEDHNDFPLGIRFDDPVREDAVLFHGCDDGSLAELMTVDVVAAASEGVTPKEHTPKKVEDSKGGPDPDILLPHKKIRAKVPA